MTETQKMKYGYYRDLITFKVGTLRLLARNLGIENWQKISKTELINKLWNNYINKINS